MPPRLFAAAAVLSVACASAADAPKPAPSRPNIVLILADDLGYGDLGCCNPGSKIPTPNFDRLASQGLLFTEAHTPSSVCTPTRYGLLTGRYCWRTRLKSGVLNGYGPALLEPGRMTLASLLKKHGYATACVGKWHLGLGDAKQTDYSRPLRPGPLTVGFDRFFGIPASLDMAPYLYVNDEAPLVAPTEKIGDSKMRRVGGEGFWRAGPIAPGFRHIDVLPTLTDKALGWIAERAGHAAEGKTPFFLYFPLNGPHTPWLPTAEFQGRSGAGPYGDFVMQVDDVVGRVMAALDKHKLADDTLLIVTSDNGAHWMATDIQKYAHRSNLDRRGQKADIHDAGHRVPLLVRWPGRVKAAARTAEPVCLTDFLATFAAVVGETLPADAGEDSADLSPLLLGRPLTAPLREAVVHHSADGMFSIRQGRWKLIEGLGSGGFTAPKREKPVPGGPTGQLYDLAADPGETRNVWAEHPEVVSRLQALLDGYRRDGRSVRR
jgi:arylsulfatase A-like enzyme